MSFNASDIIRRAHEFATMAHYGQVRKYHGTPYITHCESVARLVEVTIGALNANGAIAIAAAYLHDVVEDCGVSQETINRLFGTEIGTLVKWLTKVTTLDMGNRACRADMEAVRLSHAPALAQTIKLADLIDNTRDIVKHDPKFAKVYVAEKAFVVDLMVDADPTLRGLAKRQIAAARYILADDKQQAADEYAAAHAAGFRLVQHGSM